MQITVMFARYFRKPETRRLSYVGMGSCRRDNAFYRSDAPNQTQSWVGYTERVSKSLFLQTDVYDFMKGLGTFGKCMDNYYTQRSVFRQG